MVPCSISRDTSSTACTPPNERLTLVSCSSALTRSPPRPPARRDDGEAAAADDALRPEDDDEDEDDAIDDVAIGRKLAHDLGQRGEEDRAHDGADHVRRPSDHGKREELDRAGDAVLGRVDEEVDVRLERTRVAGDDRTDDEGDHLVDGHVDAVAGGRQLVLANRRPGLAEPSVGQPPHQVGQDWHRDQDGDDAAQRVGTRVLQALALARDGHVEDHAQPQCLDEADGGDREEDAAEPQNRKTDKEADRARQQRANEHIHGQGHRQVEAQDDGGVGADRHETGVGEGELSGVERNEDGDGENGVDADLRDQQLVLVVEAHRIGEQLYEEVHGPLSRHYSRSRSLAPKSPWGRRTKTRKRAAKATPASMLLPKRTNAKTSMRPRRYPPKTAPGMLPMPPRTITAR